MWSLNDFSDNIAVIDENGVEFSYGQLRNECDRLASEIKPGRCLIFCLCSNTVGSLIGYVSFLGNHIVPLMLDAHLERSLLYSLIKNYKPDYLWVPSGLSREFKRYKTVYSAYDYSLIKTEYTLSYPMHNDLALLLTTSGSTGSPKLVRQSYGNIEANTKSIVSYLELDHSERPITTLPMSYTYGLSILNSHLHVGASVILTQKTVMQREFWQQFKDYGATSFGGVPYTYEMLDKLRFTRMELPSLRTMTQAGGKLPPELHKKFAEYAEAYGKRFIVMYGQTEATARMAYLPYKKSLEKIGSMGIAIPGGNLTIIDADGTEICGSESTGELVYEGANVTLGYAENGSDLIKGDEWHGRLITGDMAKRDEDGFYYIIGRKKRFLKIFGNRVNLDETERMIKSAFIGIECACAGVDDKMYVLITEGSAVDAVQGFLVNKTGLNPIAFKVLQIESIPKNDSGKIQYIELEKFYK